MSPSQNKPPEGYEVWFVEYPEMVRLAAKWEGQGQTDSYWHSRKADIEQAIRYYGLEDEAKEHNIILED